MKKLLPLFFLLSLSAQGSMIYMFTISTSSLNGTSANLDFQLNPASAGSLAETAVISGLTTNGTYNPANIQLTGDATGTLPDTLTLKDTTAYNDAYQSITLGTSLKFTLTLSGPAIDTPSASGVVFGFSIYNAAGDTALLTTAPDGTIAGVEADSAVGVAPYNNNSAVAAISQAPEPSTWLLAIGSLAGAALLRIKRRT
jgi:hypothetical protein